MNSGYECECECCGKQAPFKKADGITYLEVHHVVTLAEGGPDKVENAVAVCPGCQRALHYAADRADKVDSLYEILDRLVRTEEHTESTGDT